MSLVSLFLTPLYNPPQAYAQVFGNISPPPGVDKFVSKAGGQGAGLFLLISNLFKLAGVIAGIYFLFQIITAGYQYISSSGDSRVVEKAWAQIWQSILGLIIVAGAFLIAATIGRLFGIDIINPVIYGPQ